MTADGERGLRGLVHRFVPAHFRDPVGLARRVWTEGGTEGRFAIALAALGLAAAPFDLALRPFERRRYRKAAAPQHPIILVCGPARSGTTVLAQVLIDALPVAYFTNLTSLFPRSPVTASAALRVRPLDRPGSTTSHYGRTAGFRGANDALYLWDRWLGPDRTALSSAIDDASGRDMRALFGAWETWTGRSIVAKNNSLNVHAAEVARHLPTARFICLERDPRYLAQSLLLAREYIHGDRRVPYGLAAPERDEEDAVADVIAQVRFHREVARRQQTALGPDRFRIVKYEDFCADPGATVRTVAADAGLAAVADAVPPTLPVSATPRLPAAVFARLEAAFEDEAR